MTTVALRITGLPNAASASRKKIPFATIDATGVTIKSPLAEDAPLNDHLVWLWGTVQNERRYLKSLQSEGAVIIVQAYGTRGHIEIKPNGAEMLHLLGASLLIDRP